MLSTLSPSISHWLRAYGPQRAVLVEICTLEGSRWIQQSLPPADELPVSRHASIFEHCPYCALQNLAVLPSSTQRLQLASWRPIAPTHPARRPAPSVSLWPDAQPRAPPLSA
ncbi:hypothetical protein GCM10028811_37640 [Uliginosibacterium sediminicola]